MDPRGPDLRRVLTLTPRIADSLFLAHLALQPVDRLAVHREHEPLVGVAPRRPVPPVLLEQVGELEGGLGAVTATVCGALRGWLADEGRATLERMPAAERGTSVLNTMVARLLKGQGDVEFNFSDGKKVKNLW